MIELPLSLKLPQLSHKVISRSLIDPPLFSLMSSYLGRRLPCEFSDFLSSLGSLGEMETILWKGKFYSKK